jgi:hypothetical protein
MPAGSATSLQFDSEISGVPQLQEQLVALSGLDEREFIDRMLALRQKYHMEHMNTLRLTSPSSSYASSPTTPGKSYLDAAVDSQSQPDHVLMKLGPTHWVGVGADALSGLLGRMQKDVSKHREDHAAEIEQRKHDIRCSRITGLLLDWIISDILVESSINCGCLGVCCCGVLRPCVPEPEPQIEPEPEPEPENLLTTKAKLEEEMDQLDAEGVADADPRVQKLYADWKLTWPLCECAKQFGAEQCWCRPCTEQAVPSGFKCEWCDHPLHNAAHTQSTQTHLQRESRYHPHCYIRYKWHFFWEVKKEIIKWVLLECKCLPTTLKDAKQFHVDGDCRQCLECQCSLECVCGSEPCQCKIKCVCKCDCNVLFVMRKLAQAKLDNCFKHYSINNKTAPRMRFDTSRTIKSHGFRERVDRSDLIALIVDQHPRLPSPIEGGQEGLAPTVSNDERTSIWHNNNKVAWALAVSGWHGGRARQKLATHLHTQLEQSDWEFVAHRTIDSDIYAAVRNCIEQGNLERDSHGMQVRIKPLWIANARSGRTAADQQAENARDLDWRQVWPFETGFDYGGDYFRAFETIDASSKLSARDSSVLADSTGGRSTRFSRRTTRYNYESIVSFSRDSPLASEAAGKISSVSLFRWKDLLIGPGATNHGGILKAEVEKVHECWAGNHAEVKFEWIVGQTGPRRDSKAWKRAELLAKPLFDLNLLKKWEDEVRNNCPSICRDALDPSADDPLEIARTSVLSTAMVCAGALTRNALLHEPSEGRKSCSGASSRSRANYATLC